MRARGGRARAAGARRSGRTDYCLLLVGWACGTRAARVAGGGGRRAAGGWRSASGARVDDLNELGLERRAADEEAVHVRLLRELLAVRARHRACSRSTEFNYCIIYSTSTSSVRVYSTRNIQL